MKNSMKKYLTVCLLAAVAVTAAGCSDQNQETTSSTAGNLPQETISLDQTKQDLTFVHGGGSSKDAVEDAATADKQENSDSEDASSGEGVSGTDAENQGSDNAGTTDSAKSTTAASTQAPVLVTEAVPVTDAAGESVTDAAGEVQTEVVNVTEAVPVTDAEGQDVTNDAGEVQTEVVNVTEPPREEPQENPGSQNNDATEAANTSSYSPSYDTCQAYWLDMSQEGDFFFNGEFLAFEFEVKEGTPDGSYPITIDSTDIASWDIVRWDPQIINGEVAVNTQAAAQEDMPDSDFGLKVNSVSAKPGDTVKVTIDLANNPGFCGFVIEVKYDKNALEMIDSYGGADFDTAIHYVK